jgi:hypothetical protein
LEESCSQRLVYTIFVCLIKVIIDGRFFFLSCKDCTIWDAKVIALLLENKGEDEDDDEDGDIE